MYTKLEDYDLNSIKSITFKIPTKIDNVYRASIDTPVNIELNTSEILKIFMNDKNQYELWYKMNMDDDKSGKLFSLLNILDDVALEESLKNSLEWFNKKISINSIKALYIPSYDVQVIDNKEVIYMKLYINSKEIVDKIKCDANCKFLISIDGLYFYKSNYLYNVVITDVLDVINFSDIFNKDAPAKLNISDKKSELMESLEDQAVPIPTSIPIPKENNQLDMEYNNIDKSVITNLTSKELESIIDEKRTYTKKCFLQAEKVSRAAENLRLKAIQSVNQLRKYEKTYDNLEY